jgi:ParB-like chromosome segregation protein Spo0J
MNYKIEYIDIEKVIPYEKNNQVHTEEDIKQLADMIERFGFDVPVIVDEDYVLIKGHKRRLAQMLRGEKKIMAIVRNDMSEEDKRAARIADNYVAKKAEWQFEYLTEEFNYFKSIGYDMNFVGFQEYEIEAIMSQMQANVDSVFSDTISDGAFLGHLDKKSEHFQVTFMFDLEHKELVEGVIKLQGKEIIKERIIEYCEGVANA